MEDLNIDVLELIAKKINHAPSIINLFRTCKTLYRNGKKIDLKNQTIILQNRNLVKAELNIWRNIRFISVFDCLHTLNLPAILSLNDDFKITKVNFDNISFDDIHVYVKYDKLKSPYLCIYKYRSVDLTPDILCMITNVTIKNRVVKAFPNNTVLKTINLINCDLKCDMVESVTDLSIINCSIESLDITYPLESLYLEGTVQLLNISLNPEIKKLTLKNTVKSDFKTIIDIRHCIHLNKLNIDISESYILLY
jgi:hypothetical protein